jgi:hypothetical protein
MKSIRVRFDDGNTLVTDINGTIEEIRSYYIGQVFNLGVGENDLLVTATDVDILTEE